VCLLLLLPWSSKDPTTQKSTKQKKAPDPAEKKNQQPTTRVMAPDMQRRKKEQEEEKNRQSTTRVKAPHTHRRKKEQEEKKDGEGDDNRKRNNNQPKQ
jgi:hypothetical protein